MFIRYFIFICIAALSSCTVFENENPIVGKWSLEKSCHSALLLTKNHQISGGAIIGTWEERKDFIELNIAQKTKGQLQFVQVLTTKPASKKIRILQIVYPEKDWPWEQNIGDILYKC